MATYTNKEYIEYGGYTPTIKTLLQLVVTEEIFSKEIIRDQLWEYFKAHCRFDAEINLEMQKKTELYMGDVTFNQR